MGWRKPAPVETPPKSQAEPKMEAPVPSKTEELVRPAVVVTTEEKPTPTGDISTPKPGKEYAKFFPDEIQRSSEAAKPQPAVLRDQKAEPQKEPQLAVARQAQREKPQGFPWMVAPRGTKKDDLVPQAAAARPSEAEPEAEPEASLEPVKVVAKKATDVIPALGGLKKNLTAIPVEVVKPPAPVAMAEPSRHGEVKPPTRAPSPDLLPSTKPASTPPPKTVPTATVLKIKHEDIAPILPEQSGEKKQPSTDLEVPPVKPKRPRKSEFLRTVQEEDELARLGPAWIEGFAAVWVVGRPPAREASEAGAPEVGIGEPPDLASPEKEVSDGVAEDGQSPGGEQDEPAQEKGESGDEALAGSVKDADDAGADQSEDEAETAEEGESADAEQAEEEDESRFGPSTIASHAAVPNGVSKKETDRISDAPAGPMPGDSSQVSARVLRLADVISGAGARSEPSGPLGAIWEWIEDHLPLLLVTSLLLTVGVTVYALWRSAEGKAISEAGFRTTADFQTYQKGVALVRRGKIREAVEMIRTPATRVSADPGLRSFYFELRAAQGDQPSTPAEIGELLKSGEKGGAEVARILVWESAWHHPDIDGRMRSVKVLTRLGLVHRLPLAEREVRRALGESAEAALGPRPAGLDGYRWDERFVRWYYLKAATGDNSARDHLIQWIKDPHTDRIRKEAASIALLELDEPDAEKIVHDVWQQEQTRIEAINFRVTTSRALGIDGGKLPPEEVRRIREWATKELGFLIARAFGLLYEHGIPTGLELLETTARHDGVYGFPAMAAVAELNRVLGGKALARMSAIRDYWRSELDKLRADPKEAASEAGQTFQKVMGRIIEAVTIEMARAGDGNAIKEVTAGLSSDNDFEKVQAALKLGERGLELAMPVLVPIAQGTEKPTAAQEERKEAKRIVIENGQGPVARAYLESLLPDPDAAVRFGAATRILELKVEAEPKAMPTAEPAPSKTGK